MKSYIKAFKNYAKFSGRTSRKDFWMFILFYFLFGIVFIFIDVVFDLRNHGYGNYAGFGYTFTIYQIITFLPNLSISVRRLHDIGKSGFYVLLCLIPFGGLFVWYWCAKPGIKGQNEYDSQEIDAYLHDPYAKQVDALKASKQVKRDDQDFVMEKQISLDDIAKEISSSEPATHHREESNKKHSNIPLIVCAILLVCSIAGNVYLISQNSQITHEAELWGNKFTEKQSDYRELLEWKYDVQTEYKHFHNHAVMCSDWNNYYHSYDCSDWDTNGFYIFNTENAEHQGYRPCPRCQ